MSYLPLKRMRAAAGLALCVLACGSCGDALRQDRSASYLVVDLMEAASGAVPGQFGMVLASDVLTYVKRTVGTEQVLVPTVFEDIGRVSMHIALKDIGNNNNATPTPNNDITINRYRVVYVRADGRNTAGVDVPYPFDGAITGTISSGRTSLTFILVRAQAKEEAPLKALTASGGAVLISTIAQVTFYGRDQAGHDVSITAQVSVNFGDWGDPV
jgi:hypothetical protein